MGRVSLKVVPSSSRDQITGWLGASLKIKVQAPPEKGKANAAVIALLARSLKIDKNQLSLVSGETSPVKVIEVTDCSDEDLRERLTAITS
ncbi:DUF167 domain-containing protein [Rubinisphaera margarita]|uniref:DUF167 domain-containing protein n=1 Tax=Rubinisphaera margarita TaxID=2909586 RepID=UPI001EE83ED1|nr:DUF167 domain-containing protein [Rubinisphaera margarita]MCG6155513.1 DUF167 domain-containing protein [Rubinisphaera margarita]